MIEPTEEQTTCSQRRNSIEEEQSLCNEALKSSKYDELSDSAWISLCEEAAAKGRKPDDPPLSPSGAM